MQRPPSLHSSQEDDLTSKNSVKLKSSKEQKAKKEEELRKSTESTKKAEEVKQKEIEEGEEREEVPELLESILGVEEDKRRTVQFKDLHNELGPSTQSSKRSVSIESSESSGDENEKEIKEEIKEDDEDDQKFNQEFQFDDGKPFNNSLQPVGRFASYGQWFAQTTHQFAVGLVGITAVNRFVQPLIPVVPAPFGPMVTAGGFTLIVSTYNSVRTVLTSENPLRYLENHGSVLRGIAHETAKFTVSLATNSGIGLGMGYAFEYAGPALAQSTNAAAEIVGYAINNATITTAVISFTAFVVKNGIEWAYDRAKKTPTIGLEKDPTLHFLQSLPNQLGLRLGVDIAAYEAFKAAMTSFGLGEVLINNPSAGFVFALAFDQLLAQPTQYFGYTDQPINSLVPKPRLDGYTRISGEEEKEIENTKEEEIKEEKGPRESEVSITSDLESTGSFHLQDMEPTKAQQVKAVVGVGLRFAAVTMVGYGLLKATEALANSMGDKVDTESELSKVTRLIEVTALTVVTERAFEKFGPLVGTGALYVSEKVAEGARSVGKNAMAGAGYVAGSIGTGAALFGRRVASIPCPTFGLGASSTPGLENNDLRRRRHN